MVNYSPSFTALFDACVLYPPSTRDILLELAAHSGLFRAKWTERINDEWIEAVLREREDLEREQLEYARENMNRSVDDVLVTGYQDLIGLLELPDPDDRHVLAAAIVGHVDVIVTTNLDDFPEDELSKYNIEAQHPDEFLVNVYTLDQMKVQQAVRNIFDRLTNPPKTRNEFLEGYENQGLTEFAERLREDNWFP